MTLYDSNKMAISDRYIGTDPQTDAIWILSSTFIIFTMQSGWFIFILQLLGSWKVVHLFILTHIYLALYNMDIGN